MDYDRYFKKLIDKNIQKKQEFPNEKVLNHRKGKYYADGMDYQGFKYNSVISSKKSRTFGENFIGLIVELYIYDKDFYESYFDQLKEQRINIEQDLNIDNIVWQSPKDTPSGNVARIYAKKSVDIEDTTKWDEYTEWQINTMIKFLNVLQKYTKNLRKIVSVKKQIETQNKDNMQGAKMNSIKNIILYGAPGVGKTHNYQNIISMIEEGRSQKDIFDTVSKNLHVDLQNETFESIKKDGRIEFVTFHQSYSYEDFIEGFRPNDNGNIELEDGIFKNISNKAKDNLTDSFSNNININFKSVLEQFQLKFEIGSKLKTYSNNSEFTISKYTDKSIHIMVNENKFSISYLPLEEIYNSNKIKPINNPQDIINAMSGRFKGLATYYFSIFREMLSFKEVKQNTTDLKNFYIVIDEINRGNISKIFGELITLIEEDKRDFYDVTLPYSKEKFKVPSNLYIIATMNSTDKSIATIDIALRRRFTFLKMKPKAELIKDENAKKLFNDLNDFISHKDKGNLGEDYMLGHSYFMKIESDEDLEFVKEYKIRPLLEEYFYADEENYTKAVAILNKENID